MARFLFQGVVLVQNPNLRSNYVFAQNRQSNNLIKIEWLIANLTTVRSPQEQIFLVIFDITFDDLGHVCDQASHFVQ